jgi:hypothetical protein
VSRPPSRERTHRDLSFRSLDEQIASALTQERLVATLAGFFGVLGLLLAAVGPSTKRISVTSRRGDRHPMALGAARAASWR